MYYNVKGFMESQVTCLFFFGGGVHKKLYILLIHA